MKADFCFWAKTKFYGLKGETFYILHLWLGYQRGSMPSEIHLSPKPTSDIYRKLCRRAYRRKSERHCQERFLDLALETEDEGHGFDDWHSRETSRRAITKIFVRDSISYILYVRFSVWSSAASKNYAGKRVHVLQSSLYENVQHTKLREHLHILLWNSLPSWNSVCFLAWFVFTFARLPLWVWSLPICSTLALFPPPPPLSLSSFSIKKGVSLH